jgi:hypothetical protein
MAKTFEDMVVETQLKIMKFTQGTREKNLDDSTP